MRRTSSIRPRRNVFPVVQSSNDAADAINVTRLLNRIGPLPQIPRNLVKPIVRFDKPLSHESLDHRIPQNGTMRLPVGHFIANHLVAKLPQRLEAFSFSKRRLFLQSRRSPAAPAVPRPLPEQLWRRFRVQLDRPTRPRILAPPLRRRAASSPSRSCIRTARPPAYASTTPAFRAAGWSEVKGCRTSR
jgi:hypothetical protein